MMFLSGAEKIYTQLSRFKNIVYDAGILDSVHLNTPVISVGNLTVGGTGKTPITQMIIEYYLEKMIRPMVIGRNYKGKLSGIAKVDLSRIDAAQMFGDEPTLLAQKNPEVPIFVGPCKWKTGLAAVTQYKPDVIVIDDGFQHRALHRDLDIVLLDATVPLEDYRLLPLGKAREGLSSLHRANWILLTKTNLAEESHVNQLKALLPKQAKVLEVAYRLEGHVDEAGARAIGFSGLARPESFKQSIAQDTLYNMIDFIEFEDHFQYSREVISHLLDTAKRKDAQYLLTTEKDWVKIKNMVDDPGMFRVLELKTFFLNQPEEFHATLDRMVR